MLNCIRLQLLYKLREANVNNSINTSEAENRVNIVKYFLFYLHYHHHVAGVPGSKHQGGVPH
jgi:hypothetical protein